MQYRFGAHTTADDPSVYGTNRGGRRRDRDTEDRTEKHLYNEGILDSDLESEIQDSIEQEVSEAIETAEQTEASPDNIVEHVYEDVPARLEEQRDELNRLREKYDDGAFSEVLE